MSNAPHPLAPFPYAITRDDGTVEKFNIKPLTISGLYRFIDNLAREDGVALVATCTGKDTEWVDSLDLDQFTALCAKCHEINFRRATGLMKGDPVVSGKLMPVIHKMGVGFKLAIEAAQFGTSSPMPAPSGSAPATGTGSATPIPSESSSGSSQPAAA